MSSRIVLITGANTGLGFQIVRSLCSSSEAYHIIVGGRSLEKAEKAIEDAQAEFPSSKSRLSSIQVDVEEDDSISQAFEKVKAQHGRLDVLINNAGAQIDQQLAAGKMTMREMWNQSWNVNTTGAQLMTSAFVPLLLESSDPRLLFITSGTATLEGHDNPALFLNKSPAKGWPKESMGVPAYRSAKTGMNMMMAEWHRLLGEDGVKTWSISPGYLATGLGAGSEQNKKMGAGDPAQGGEFIRSVVEGHRDKDVGKAINKDGIQAW